MGSTGVKSTNRTYESILPKEHYINNWDYYLSTEQNQPDYVNMEQLLQNNLKVYSTISLAKDDFDKIVKMEAQKIYNQVRESLLDRKRVIDDLKAGRSSLGYTTMNQERAEMSRIVKRFEFNSAQLSEFKRKHLN